MSDLKKTKQNKKALVIFHLSDFVKVHRIIQVICLSSYTTMPSWMCQNKSSSVWPWKSDAYITLCYIKIQSNHDAQTKSIKVHHLQSYSWHENQ